LIVVLLIVVAFSAGTVVRNNVWQSEFTLWRDTAQKNPENSPARVSYGVELAKMDRLEEALIELKEGVRLNPRGSGARNNIGILYAKLGNFERAAYEFKLAAEFDSTNLEAKKNLAQALQILKGTPAGGGAR
jgi:Flp pilus assembly protein TadD